MNFIKKIIAGRANPEDIDGEYDYAVEATDQQASEELRAEVLADLQEADLDDAGAADLKNPTSDPQAGSERSEDQDAATDAPHSDADGEEGQEPTTEFESNSEDADATPTSSDEDQPKAEESQANSEEQLHDPDPLAAPAEASSDDELVQEDDDAELSQIALEAKIAIEKADIAQTEAEKSADEAAMALEMAARQQSEKTAPRIIRQNSEETPTEPHQASLIDQSEPEQASPADDTNGTPALHSTPEITQNVVEVPIPSIGRAGRRAGRVKTRLLGFEHASDGNSNPFEAAAPPPESGQEAFPTGWIVVTDGPGRGYSFTLRNGVSQIGRGEDQAIRLNMGDNSISRSNHAAVAFDHEQNKFFLGHGGKANLVRLNNEPLLCTEELSSGDLIKIGETSLRFIALCDEAFDWEMKSDENDAAVA